jgi:hypothetical protein
LERGAKAQVTKILHPVRETCHPSRGEFSFIHLRHFVPPPPKEDKNIKLPKYSTPSSKAVHPSRGEF